MYANFLLGRCTVTDEVRDKLQRIPLDFIARHAVNEHGLISNLERKRNQLAMQRAGKIISRYMVNPTNPEDGFVEVETSAGWQTTTVRIKEQP